MDCLGVLSVHARKKLVLDIYRGNQALLFCLAVVDNEGEDVHDVEPLGSAEIGGLEDTRLDKAVFFSQVVRFGEEVEEVLSRIEVDTPGELFHDVSLENFVAIAIPAAVEAFPVVLLAEATLAFLAVSSVGAAAIPCLVFVIEATQRLVVAAFADAGGVADNWFFTGLEFFINNLLERFGLGDVVIDLSVPPVAEGDYGPLGDI